MGKPVAWGAAALITGLMVVAGGAAHAGPSGPVPLSPAPLPGDTSDIQLQVGGLDFWVASCSLTVAGVTQGCNGLQLAVAGSSATNVAVVIESATPGGHILDIPANDIPVGPNSYDLSVALDVETIACANNPISGCNTGGIKSDALSLTGNVSPSTNDQFVTAAESITLADGTSLPPVTASLGSPTTATFGAQPFVIATKDIGDELSRITGPVNGPVTIDTVTQNFGVVPEPASVGLFLAGLAALGVARRRVRRVTRPS